MPWYFQFRHLDLARQVPQHLPSSCSRRKLPKKMDFFTETIYIKRDFAGRSLPQLSFVTKIPDKVMVQICMHLWVCMDRLCKHEIFGCDFKISDCALFQ